MRAVGGVSLPCDSVLRASLLSVSAMFLRFEHKVITFSVLYVDFAARIYKGGVDPELCLVRL